MEIGASRSAHPERARPSLRVRDPTMQSTWYVGVEIGRKEFKVKFSVLKCVVDGVTTTNLVYKDKL